MVIKRADTEAMTGVTVILCPEGATAAADVRGTATGTRQFDSLRIGHSLSSCAHAVVLAGGTVMYIKHQKNGKASK